MAEALACRIVVEGTLTQQLGDAFDGFAVMSDADRTVLEGPVTDQSQLAALMDRLFGLGIRVVSFTTENE